MADETESKVRVLRIIADGEVVAEVPVIIHNPEKAWTVFSAAFHQLAHLTAGELFEAMRLATNEEALKSVGGDHTGMLLNVQTRPASGLVIPTPEETMSRAQRRAEIFGRS